MGIIQRAVFRDCSFCVNLRTFALTCTHCTQKRIYN
nr:MAG TPA: RNA polymerase III-like protein [Caudoviricetes sp.]